MQRNSAEIMRKRFHSKVNGYERGFCSRNFATDEYKKEKGEVSEDSKIRMTIHEKIENYIHEGKTAEQIEAILREVEEYQKYKIFLPGWIRDKINKLNKNAKSKTTKKKEDEIER